MTRCPSYDYEEGWEARRNGLPLNLTWTKAKQNGWIDHQRDDLEEEAFFDGE